MYDFLIKWKDNGSTWKEVSEEAVRKLLKVYYPDDEIDDQLQNIKFGHRLQITTAEIEAWPREKNGEEKNVKGKY